MTKCSTSSFDNSFYTMILEYKTAIGGVENESEVPVECLDNGVI